MSSKVTLTRNSLERIITVLAMDENIVLIDIKQDSFGIGPVHVVTFHKPDGHSYDQDITDVSNW